jgi:pteridine reductase
VNANPVALVTGAGRRIGAAIIRTLHAAGYDVALHCRHSIVEAHALADELNDLREDSAGVLQADLADPDAPHKLIASLVARTGRLDVLVNNASSFFATPVGSSTAAMWDELFASNAKAPFFLCQAAAPALRDSRGSIVNIVDIYAERPLADHPVYCMAKAALAAMTRSLALDLAPGVRVNGVAPGAVLWPAETNPYEDQPALLERTPLRCAGSPQDVADTVLFLVRSPFVTGQILTVDGGRTLAV